MRYFMFVMGNAAYEAGRPQPDKLYELMGEFVQKELASGRLVSTAGLKPTRHGYRVAARNGAVTVTDGPFAEAREVIGGYAIVEAGSDEEVLAMARDFMDVHIRGGVPDAACEIRPIEGRPDA